MWPGLLVVAFSIVLLRVQPNRMHELPDGMLTPVLALELARTPGEIERDAPWPGQHTEEALADWGFADGEITKMPFFSAKSAMFITSAVAVGPSTAEIFHLLKAYFTAASDCEPSVTTPMSQMCASMP